MVTVKGSLLSFLIVTTSVFLITAPLHSVQAQKTGKQKKKQTKKISDVRVDRNSRNCISRLAKCRAKYLICFFKSFLGLVKKLEKFFCVESVYVRCKPALALCCHIEQVFCNNFVCCLFAVLRQIESTYVVTRVLID